MNREGDALCYETAAGCDDHLRSRFENEVGWAGRPICGFGRLRRSLTDPWPDPGDLFERIVFLVTLWCSAIDPGDQQVLFVLREGVALLKKPKALHGLKRGHSAVENLFLDCFGPRPRFGVCRQWQFLPDAARAVAGDTVATENPYHFTVESHLRRDGAV